MLQVSGLAKKERTNYNLIALESSLINMFLTPDGLIMAFLSIVEDSYVR